MSRTRTLTYTFVIIATLIGIPHYVAENISLPEYTQEAVDTFFYIFNDLSVLYIIVPFFILELIRYFVMKKLSKNLALDSITNVLTVGFFTVINYILGLLFASKVYVWASMHSILPELPLTWVTILACILLADFLYYWEHRLMHEMGAGWLTHTVHHSSEHFNMSVAYRFGPLDGFFPLFFSVPAVLMGFNPLLMLAAELFVQTFQAVLHTEVIGKLFRPIEYIFNTPSHHRVHHGSNRQYWDKNYAGILIVWDRLLKTFEPEVEKVRYGISEPINSVNPITVFFHGVARFYKKLKHTKGFGNKLLSFVKAPHWMPEGQTYPPQTSEDK
jgi:sterol desaturase/sphingolipid hydroxylase (fatty acid hydroxylase superfamily)